MKIICFGTNDKTKKVPNFGFSHIFLFLRFQVTGWLKIQKLKNVSLFFAPLQILWTNVLPKMLSVHFRKWPKNTLTKINIFYPTCIFMVSLYLLGILEKLQKTAKTAVFDFLRTAKPRFWKNAVFQKPYAYTTSFLLTVHIIC